MPNDVSLEGGSRDKQDQNFLFDTFAFSIQLKKEKKIISHDLFYHGFVMNQTVHQPYFRSERFPGESEGEDDGQTDKVLRHMTARSFTITASGN